MSLQNPRDWQAAEEIAWVNDLEFRKKVIAAAIAAAREEGRRERQATHKRIILSTDELGSHFWGCSCGWAARNDSEEVWAAHAAGGG